MLQKDFAKRMTASNSSKYYGRISIISQYFYQCKKIFSITPLQFYPKPKIQSTIIELKSKNIIIHPLQFTLLENICKIFFNYRRKKIKYILKKYKINYHYMFYKKELINNKRTENLLIKNFYQISCLKLLKNFNNSFIKYKYLF